MTGAVVVDEGDGVDEGDDDGAFASAIANTGFARVRGRPTVFRRRDDGTLDTCGIRRCTQQREAVEDDNDSAEENAGSLGACMMLRITVDNLKI